MSRLAKNAAYNFVGQAALVVLAFASVKLINSRLGADALGILYFSVTVSAVL